ncbi:MAG: tetraacyldisaccharide 4'-kinase [Phycisphaerales bacterium]
MVTSKDLPAGLKPLRWILLVLSWFYGLVISIRNRLYDLSIFKSVKVPAAVVSIGNLTTGGTGKTPLVAWLCNYFIAQNIPTAVLTRGYKQKNDIADEPAMLAKAVPSLIVLVNPNRVQSAQKAINESKAKLLVMDDGFQHRKLARDVNIVAIDATIPFGNEHLLPAGLLREPIKALKRADAVVITRANQNSPEIIDEIKKKVSKIKPDIVFAAAVHKPTYVKLIKDKRIPLEQLKDRKIYAFCGIGNPDAFFQTLKDMSLNIVGTKVYNDHHVYTADDIEAIYEDARYKQSDYVLTTHKDWIKTALLSVERFQIPFAAMMVELDFVDGRQNIIDLVNKALMNK